MKDTEQKHGCRLMVAVLIWIVTWALMIPIPHGLAGFPKQASSLWGLGYLMAQPISRFRDPVDGFIAYHSFYIGLLSMLVASGIVVFVSGKSRRVMWFVTVVDALILAIWVIVSWP